MLTSQINSNGTSNHYRVSWAIDIEAYNPEEAAKQSRHFQVKHHTSAVVTDVAAKDREITRVDFD